jgi:thiamine-monophosphate kinase
VAFAVAAAALATAGMDLSDGLAADLPRLCRASGVGATIDPAALPDHPALHAGPASARTLQLAGGDDYQLLLTADPAQLEALHAAAQEHSVSLSVVGRVTAGPAALPVDGPWPSAPWAHFSEGA